MTEDVGPPLVGRDRELAVIDAVLARARDGISALVLRGAPGCGLSRLLDEACLRATAAGFRTSRAGTSPLEADLGWAVLVALLRPLVLGGSGGRRTTLTDGLPELARLLPALGPAPPGSGDLDLDRLRLYDAVHSLLGRLTRTRPLLLVVDDVEDADPVSVAALVHAARASPRMPIAVLVGSHGEAAEAPAVAALRRLPQAVTHDVPDLDPDAVRALLGELLDEVPSADVADYLLEQAQGSPLLTRAVTATLIATDGLRRDAGRWVLTADAATAAPTATVELARRRLGRLDLDQRLAVQLIALAGGQLEHVALLRALRALGTTADPDETVARTSTSSLVRTDTTLELRYRLSHPVLTEAATSELAALERRRCHAALAHAIGDADGLDRKAVQVALAGDLVEDSWAAGVLVDALERAVQRAAGDAAARHAEAALLRLHALDSADTGGAAALQELRRRALLGRARAAELTGPVDAAVRAWRDVAETALADGRATDEAEAALRLARFDADAGRLETAVSRLAALRTTARWPSVSTPMRIEVLDGLLAIMMRRAQADPAALAELSALAAASGSATARQRARLRRLQTAIDAFDLHAVRDIARGLRSDEPEIVRAVGVFEVEWGDPRAALRALEAAVRRARAERRLAAELRVAEVRLLALLRCDEWTAALDAARQVRALSVRLGSGRGAAYAHLASGLALIPRGEVTAARAELGAAYEAYPPAAGDDRHLAGYADLLQGHCDLASGRPEAVTHRHERRVGVGPSLIRDYYLQYGEALCRVGDLDRLAELTRRIHDGGLELPAARSLHDQLSGMLARERGDSLTAARLFAAAAVTAAGAQQRYDAASCRLRWAELVPPAEAAPVLEAELAVLLALGAAPAVRRARRLLRRASAAPPPRRARHRAGDLTHREQQIAALVADGLTDAEIADRLVLSTRTVTTHLQHAYRRLGVSGRAALTRHVLESRERPDT